MKQLSILLLFILTIISLSTQQQEFIDLYKNESLFHENQDFQFEESQESLLQNNQEQVIEKSKQQQLSNLRNLQRTFDSTYKCGECLNYGYKSCIGKNAKDHPFVSSYTKTDATYNSCCQLSENCKDASQGFACSSSYNNTLYAKYNCPFNTAVCGTNDTVVLEKVGAVANLSMAMIRGETCFYKIKNTCGRNKIDLIRVDNSDSILIEYIEYESGQIMQGTEYAHGKQGGAPAVDMPYRTETFVYDTERKVYQGRLFNTQGWHLWGSLIQNQESGLPSNTGTCANRYTYLVVTSLTDTTSQVRIGIEVMNYQFAKYLALSFSIILMIGLINIL
eukprot:403359692